MNKWFLSIVLVLALVLSGFIVGPMALQRLATPAVYAQAPSQTPSSSPAAQTVLPANAQALTSWEGAMEAIYQSVSPSVVYIEVTQGGGTTSGNAPTNPRFRQYPQQGSGSGFVWDKEGRIVTNNHVVDGATSVDVTFSDGTTAAAKVVGTDPNSDLAVIQVSVPADKLQPVTMADSSQLKVGQIAIAIGNPFGLESTLTVGYVSGLGRTLPGQSTQGNAPVYSNSDIIQTDAPINPGNSGGVLLNSSGQVIGVTSAIISPVGTSSGVGFAIPANTVKSVVPTLVSGGRVAYPWLGISGTSLTSDLAQAMNLKADQRGALIAQVTSGGPAEKAGLRGSQQAATVNGRQIQVGGDVIVAIDGQAITGFDALASYLVRSTKPGQNVTLTILRDGQQQQVQVTLGERPAA